MTTRGLKEREMEVIGRLLDSVLSHPEDNSRQDEARRTVRRLCRDFPLYSRDVIRERA